VPLEGCGNVLVLQVEERRVCRDKERDEEGIIVEMRTGQQERKEQVRGGGSEKWRASVGYDMEMAKRVRGVFILLRRPRGLG
jgi:hypothetical protein